ncbi:MAG: UDP-N-acetylmuramoyl-tripeptide--D-alanyl-D-alanine ligase [Ferruginibacter sp.]|nr:UDP-N-acetylmuramoyl-tripeptide--D-alanyl-D-alanine ligase [Ferruginibacter sp.]
MQTDELYQLFLRHPEVETDTRKIKAGAIFFALKGPNFNGNHYTSQALAAGASYCVVDEAPTVPDERIIQVNDSLVALQSLAKKHRQQFDIPFIAVTGSNGKTTSKELIQEVLLQKFRSYTTAGNLNNHIGIPLTILRVKTDAEIAVIEMGANHQGEIAAYCSYTLPTHGLITNCGKAHLEGFGGEAGVRKGKGELFDYLRNNDGTAFIYRDYDYLTEMSAGIPHVVPYGTEHATYTGLVANDHEFLTVKITAGADIDLISTKLIGGYNLPNILAAVTIGKTFDVEDNKIKTALEQYQPSNSRSQLLEKGTTKVILDAYNANPTSMKAAIENFARMDGDKKILILGSMMELGTESDAEHDGVVELIQKYAWADVALAGTGYKNVPPGILRFDNSVAVRDWLTKQDIENAQILVKGSRSMQMEKVLDGMI